MARAEIKLTDDQKKQITSVTGLVIETLTVEKMDQKREKELALHVEELEDRVNAAIEEPGAMPTTGSRVLTNPLARNSLYVGVTAKNRLLFQLKK